MAGMYKAIDAREPDQIIHLGDLQRDAEMLSDVYPHIPVCGVPGNCDGWTMDPPKKRITLAGKVILLAHGHNWYVKRGYDYALADARKAGADILLFGHTHQALCKRMEDGLWVMNPGTSRSTYGVITIENGEIQCEVLPI